MIILCLENGKENASIQADSSFETLGTDSTPKQCPASLQPEPSDSNCKRLENRDGITNNDQTTVHPFKFNVVDGGFTCLHEIWKDGENRNHDIDENYIPWGRLHDYWFLVGIIKHGHGRWQDILADDDLSILQETFKDKSLSNDIKNKYLAGRLKMLEQALLVEEQLRRADQSAFISEEPSSITLERGLREIRYMLEAHEHLLTDDSQTTRDILQRVLGHVDERLCDLKSEASRIASSVSKQPSITSRLQLNERNLLAKFGFLTNEGNKDQYSGNYFGAEESKNSSNVQSSNMQENDTVDKQDNHIDVKASLAEIPENNVVNENGINCTQEVVALD